jgi:superfamily I DNA and RNA helicase
LLLERYSFAMLTPTSQQQAIIDAVAEGKDMVIQALAGTGKTTTLRMIAEHYPDKKFLYIVFNKSQQLEAQKKMPSNVEPRTCDSLAWKFVNRV